MKKEIRIDGMHCAHCSARVEEALNSLDGVKAKVNLKKGIAVIKSDRDIPDEVLRNAVEELGFSVI